MTTTQTAIQNIKSELKTRFNLSVQCHILQGGCIAIKHSQENTIKVRYIVRLLGLERMTAQKYKDCYCKSTTADTICHEK